MRGVALSSVPFDSWVSILVVALHWQFVFLLVHEAWCLCKVYSYKLYGSGVLSVQLFLRDVNIAVISAAGSGNFFSMVYSVGIAVSI